MLIKIRLLIETRTLKYYYKSSLCKSGASIANLLVEKQYLSAIY